MIHGLNKRRGYGQEVHFSKLPQFYGAAIGALINAGTSIYTASQAQKNIIRPQQIKDSDLHKLNLGSANQGLEQYLTQAPYLNSIQGMLNTENTESNQGWQAQLESLDPNILKSVTQMGQNTLSDLQGNIPKSVQDQMASDTAQQSMQGGYAGTGMARNLTARDLGLTSLNLQQTGAGDLTQQLGDLTALNPSNASLSSTLFSPQQLLQRDDNQTQYNTDLENQAMFYNKGSLNSGQMGMALGANNSANALASAGNSIGSLFSNKQVQSTFSGLFGGGNTNKSGVTANATLGGGAGAGGSAGVDNSDPDPDSQYLTSSNDVADNSGAMAAATMNSYDSLFG